MYREQLDRPEISALALQPGIEKGGGGLQGQVAKMIFWCEKGYRALAMQWNVTCPEHSAYHYAPQQQTGKHCFF